MPVIGLMGQLGIFLQYYLKTSISIKFTERLTTGSYTLPARNRFIHLVLEDGLQLLQFQGRGDPEHAVAVKASIGYEKDRATDDRDIRGHSGFPRQRCRCLPEYR